MLGRVVGEVVCSGESSCSHSETETGLEDTGGPAWLGLRGVEVGKSR